MAALRKVRRILAYTNTVRIGGVIVELAPLIAARMEREREIRDLQEKGRKSK